MSTNIGQSATHVVEWLPGWMCGVPASGEWQLLTFSDYMNITYEDPSWTNTALPRSAFRAELEKWAANLLGYPVELEEDTQLLDAPRRILPGTRKVREIVYYVWPAVSA